MRGMNLVFVLRLVGAAIVGAVRGDVKAVGQGAFEGASQGVTLAIGLIGVMALWLGLMRIAEKSGLVEKLARAARPVFRPLFPAIPDGHPAISAMLLKDRKSTRLNSSHLVISYAVFCLKNKHT